MLDHEIYTVIIANTIEILKGRVVGDVYSTIEGCNIIIWIKHPQFGLFRYTFFDFDQEDCNKITSNKMAELVVLWHRNRVVDKLFLKKKPNGCDDK